MINKSKNGIISQVNTAKKIDAIEVDLYQLQQPNNISAKDILAEVESKKKEFEAIPHKEVLDELIKRIPRINFKERVYTGYAKLKKNVMN